MKPITHVSIHTAFFTHCKTGIKTAMQIISKKESLNEEDIKALRILGDVYEAMINPDLKTCGQILEDCNKGGNHD